MYILRHCQSMLMIDIAVTFRLALEEGQAPHNYYTICSTIPVGYTIILVLLKRCSSPYPPQSTSSLPTEKDSSKVPYSQQIISKSMHTFESPKNPHSIPVVVTVLTSHFFVAQSQSWLPVESYSSCLYKTVIPASKEQATDGLRSDSNLIPYAAVNGVETIPTG